ncbi:MAG: AAA family ATPase [Chloroflexi bacterium]|nr:AAA family ATPase [Chloroflexota bacterium]
MRIAVSGKGGSGKTTIAATLARLFARRGYRVSALDDDPNPNLAVALGLPADQLRRLGPVPREEILEERVDAHGVASLHLTRPFEDVIEAYGARGPDGVAVRAMTGVLGAGKG